MSARKSAVAGLFYPSDKTALRAAISGFLAQHPGAAGPAPKAIIVPHAGYIYSGPVAASAYARIIPDCDAITRVVVLGPSHRVPVRGLAAPGVAEFLTPLGAVRMDQQAIHDLLTLPQVHVADDAHALEHSIEVQLPFLQEILDTFSCVPLVVGDATAAEVGEVLDHVWGGPETLIVISSDLSHYHDYATAKKLDRATSDAILALRPAALGYDDACGRIPIAGLLTVARERGLHAELIDLRNSGDTSGPRDQVVGYGAWCFVEPEGVGARGWHRPLRHHG